ncbi:LLM class flavin-dependent oxidoreductase [Streptomyces sp. NPDC005900]|uniref:LLM class flavin-dependent oxidoreductase n=1 Tax=unclassified Streptomyces TaxID=2593676 RepID=UPI0004C999EB|nr:MULTISPECIES: LLM class flavin-dependent oxidoreductase [unclassified Streptomyces]AZM57349.1 LLM class flavin-dependent oxidoreductase [Streptomyces sp. WAC 01529]
MQATPASGLGVYYPLQPHHPSQLAPFGRLVARGYADRLWLGESLALGTHQVLAYLAGQGINPALGMGVSLMPLHNPFQAALAARSLASLSGKRLISVFGTSKPSFVAALRGAPYTSSLGAAREYVSTVRRLLDGQPTDTRGEYVHTPAQLPPWPATPHVDVGLGVLRPGMARVAAETADVALTWMAPLPYLRRELLPVLTEVRVVSVVHVLVVRPGLDVDEVVWRATHGHTGEGHYRAMLTAAGLGPIADGPSSARALVEHGVVLAGSPQTVADEIEHFWAAGVDEVVLNPTALEAEGPEAALRDLLEITEVCQSRGSARGKDT